MHKSLDALLLISLIFWGPALAPAAVLSDATETCLACHESVTPGIVGDWRASRHSRVTPTEALGKKTLERRFSASAAPAGSADVVVGCAECHTRNPETHADTFDHNGYRVHVVVSPEDCAGCHPAEREQFDKNLMANAHGNLVDNELYDKLVTAVNGVEVYEEGVLSGHAPDALTNADSCLSCHGTKVQVESFKPRKTAMGEMTFPELSGWPNQGVGRVNPDGSKGACTACHARHQFSIEVARKPYTCAQCHKGPDVPAYPVYQVSKHGNIYNSVGSGWDFEAVPWSPGVHFTAPTCATCHVSLLTVDGEVIAERTHRMNDRLPWRIFGLPYAHPHPRSADTSVIRNAADLPLPTELTGEPVREYLIGPGEMDARRGRMEKICQTCHSGQWVEGFFEKYEHTIDTTNQRTLAATKVLLDAWESGLARGLDREDSPFNEAIEQKWVQQWLFYANSTRYASAMGGADYGVFAHGRFFLSHNAREMSDWSRFLRAAEGSPSP